MDRQTNLQTDWLTEKQVDRQDIFYIRKRGLAFCKIGGLRKRERKEKGNISETDSFN